MPKRSSHQLLRYRMTQIIVVLALVPGCDSTPANSNGPGPLIVYCAHDALYSAPILERFRRETGIELTVRYDSEATKSLGLVNQLIREKDSPVCDVFWNNQVLGTTDLIRHDVLIPYRGSGWKRIPSQFKDTEGYWTGFAARLRVWIVNTESLAATDEAIEQAQTNDLSRMAIARPLFGTTLTHYCLLWHADRGQSLRRWHADTRRRGLLEVAGNATVKNLVARGTCRLGWTDTDDYFVAIDAGQPVGMRPVRLADNKTICLPNSVGIVRGTQQLEVARQLVDFLLSAETELALARSPSRQIPLGPVDETQLTDDVQQLRKWARHGMSLDGLADSRSACLEWLKVEYDR